MAARGHCFHFTNTVVRFSQGFLPEFGAATIHRSQASPQAGLGEQGPRARWPSAQHGWPPTRRPGSNIRRTQGIEMKTSKILAAAALSLLAAAGAQAETYDGVHALTSQRARAKSTSEAVRGRAQCQPVRRRRFVAARHRCCSLRPRAHRPGRSRGRGTRPAAQAWTARPSSTAVISAAIHERQPGDPPPATPATASLAVSSRGRSPLRQSVLRKAAPAGAVFGAAAPQRPLRAR